MQLKIFTKCFLFLAFLFISFSNSNAELYSGGPWRGRVIDANTKEPIEGAVVVAVWYREYDGFPDGSKTFPHDVKETLTNKDGQFEIPTYIESGKNKHLWIEKDLGGGPSHLFDLFFKGPTIREPNFIIYKPSYGNYPDQDELGIYAIGPGSSIVEYYEEHKEMYKGKLVTSWAKKKTKTFPEGIVYYGKRCRTKINALEKNLPFSFGSFFVPLENAKEKVEKLNVPLDCPDNGEPIPGSMHGFRDDIVNPLRKGGYIIIELPKLTNREDRLEAQRIWPSLVGGDIETARKIKNFIKLINEEKRYLGLPENPILKELEYEK